jgi:glycosyltransferase involved in cell wall biosynthesis
MTQKSVVHITSVHVWSDTRIFQRMCQGLARRGWTVTLVAPNVADQTVGGVRVVGVRTPASRLLRPLVGGFRAMMAARSIAADAYHFHDPELMLWKWLLRGRTVVYDMHEYVPGAITTRPWIPKPLRGPLSGLWRLAERILLRNSPTVLAENSYSRHYSWLKKRVVVLNLPDTDALLNIPEEGRSDAVVYVGRVAETRGSVRMIEAIDLLRQRGLNVRLDVVGAASDSHMQDLRNTLAAKNLGAVSLHGYMKPMDAWRIAKKARAGLAVLSPEPNYIESFPTKMFEYMALGLPVIVSDFPLYRSVVDANRCGVCVDPLDAKALADAIETLFRNPVQAQALGDNGRAAIQARYRWDQQLDALEGFYATIIPRFHDVAIR